MSPPFDFFDETFLPAIRRMGFIAEARLIRHGFYPAGGGEVVVEVRPAANPAAVDFVAPEGPCVLSARVILSRLPDRVWENERRALEESGLVLAAIERREVSDSPGPGNCIEIVMDRGEGNDRTRSVLTAFGERGRPSAAVVGEAAGYARELLESGAAADRFLADQLLIYLALAGGGSLTAPHPPSLHATTSIAVIERFLPVRFEVDQAGGVATVCCRMS